MVWFNGLGFHVHGFECKFAYKRAAQMNSRQGFRAGLWKVFGYDLGVN